MSVAELCDGRAHFRNGDASNIGQLADPLNDMSEQNDTVQAIGRSYGTDGACFPPDVAARNESTRT